MKTPVTTTPVSRRGRQKKSTISKKSFSDTTSDAGSDKTKVNVNGMLVDIENITDDQLYALRKVLPRKEYRYLLLLKLLDY